MEIFLHSVYNRTGDEILQKAVYEYNPLLRFRCGVYYADNREPLSDAWAKSWTLYGVIIVHIGKRAAASDSTDTAALSGKQ